MLVYEVHRILGEIRKQLIYLGPEIVGADPSQCCAVERSGVTLADRRTALQLPLLSSRMVVDAHGLWNQTDHSVWT